MPRDGKRQPIEERFWTKVQKTAGCWLWLGHFDKNGYGQLALPGRRGGTLQAHRFSWQLHNGPIPDGKCVLHKCDNPSCVNPKHLFLGTNYDNWHDMENKGRWKPGGCPQGEKHPLAKLSDEQVKAIRLCSLSGPELARRYGVRPQTIYAVRNRETWKHIK